MVMSGIINSNSVFDVSRWVQGDALDLPHPDCSFGAITMGYGLRNVIDKRKSLQEMYRVLKPGASISVYIQCYQLMNKELDSD